MKILDILTNAISWFKTDHKSNNKNKNNKPESKDIAELYFIAEEFMERKIYEVCKKLNECSYTNTELIQDIVKNYEKEARKWKPSKRYDEIKFTAADYSSDEENSLMCEDNEKDGFLDN